MDSRREELIRKIEENLKPPQEHLIIVKSSTRLSYKDIQTRKQVYDRYIGTRCRVIPNLQKEIKYGTIVGIMWERRLQQLFYRVRIDGEKKTITKRVDSPEIELI